MTTDLHDSQSGLGAPPAGDVPALAQMCRLRAIEREAVPMFVALQDCRAGRRLQVVDQIGLAEGSRLRELFDHYERGLPDALEIAPFRDLTGGGRLIDVLVVLSDQHLRAKPGPPS